MPDDVMLLVVKDSAKKKKTKSIFVWAQGTDYIDAKCRIQKHREAVINFVYAKRTKEIVLIHQPASPVRISCECEW